MSDLVERLRSPIIGIPVAVSNCLEAANEIERLMTLLEAEIKTTTHLAAENEKLRAALRNNGRHSEACAKRDLSDRGFSFVRHDWPCDCGLEQALSEGDDE